MYSPPPLKSKQALHVLRKRRLLRLQMQPSKHSDLGAGGSRRATTHGAAGESARDGAVSTGGSSVAAAAATDGVAGRVTTLSVVVRSCDTNELAIDPSFFFFLLLDREAMSHV